MGIEGRLRPAAGWALVLSWSCSDAGPREADGGAAPWFENVTAQAGVDFVHVNGATGSYYVPEMITGGVALFDMDRDGDLDLYLVQGGSFVEGGSREQANALYENLGDGTFRDVTAASGTGHTGFGMGVACGDYDGDGDPDLYVTNLGPNVLFRNEGGGRFVDVTREAGVGDARWGASTAFLDHDRDGDLDLFVCNYIKWSVETEVGCLGKNGEKDYCSPRAYEAPERDLLYRNDGDGTFTDVSLEAGLGAAFGNGLGIGCADFDGDGWTDVFVANDQTLDQLWINQQDGTFVDQAVFMGCAVDENGTAKAGMGVAVADVDADGDRDLLVCNLGTETDSLHLNEGGFFSDGTGRFGLAVVSRAFTRFGMGLVDFDNDGRLDLFQANGRVTRGETVWAEDPYAEPNLLFRGMEGGFEEVLPRGGTAQLAIASSRAAAFGDLDGDGGVDVVVVDQNLPPSILRNVVPDRGRWVVFRVLDERGADAIGTQLRLRVGGAWILRDVLPGYSYQASNDPRVHVGLGALEGVEQVEITWPDGETESRGPFAAGAVHTIRRGER